MEILIEEELPKEFENKIDEEKMEPTKKEEEEKKDKATETKFSKFKSFSKKYVLPHLGITIFAIIAIVLILIFRYVAKWDLTWKGWYTVVVLFVVLGFLLKEVGEPEFVLLGAMVSLVLPKIITPTEALSGFGNDAIVTIGILFVVSKGIENTNALEILLRKVLGNPKNLYIAYLRMMVKKNFLCCI